MSTALYRRYRPETFADVIAQEHVTGPLMQALRTNRVNHAYLFSGPRGCGKTTSARILARSLNCARRVADDEGRFPDAPCGECDSCVELSRKGGGSLDVVEIDAASHGGVDDARELRERATFAPARDRYKIFIIDEAHMVSTQGFNALLKIVEEPPEHVRFIFATTEPDKVLQTIRSRTHHYPFHLVPPERLLKYLEQLCAEEGVPVGKGVLPLVVRAGGGSVRDSLSVLDQLMAGAGPEGVDYEHAVALLGYTHASLLDDVVDALAAGDGATVFRVVDRVIGSGHDPRRFVEDLLERLRDLVIIQAVGDGAKTVLRGLPEDQLTRMTGQATRFGAGEVSRLADIANAALTEMTGATSPRLHLELLCARMLLPGAEAGHRGLTARVDRLERRVGMPATGGPSAAPAGGVPATGGPSAHATVPPPEPRPTPSPEPTPDPMPRPTPDPTPRPAPEPTPEPMPRPSPMPGPEPMPQPEPMPGPEPMPQPEPMPGPEPMPQPEPMPEPAPDPTRPSGAAASQPGGSELEAVRRMWPDVLEYVKAQRKVTFFRCQDARVLSLQDGVLTLGFPIPGNLKAFATGDHRALVEHALVQVIGVKARIDPVPAPSSGGGEPPFQHAAAATDAWAPPTDVTPSAPHDMPPSVPHAAASDPADAAPSAQADAEWSVPSESQAWQPPEPPAPEEASSRQPRTEPASRTNGAARVRQAMERGAGSDRPRDGGADTEAGSGDGRFERGGVALEDDVPDRDDPDAEDSGLIGAPVVEQILGGKVITVEESER
ncbi:MAG TPA: DNA polymerase III subunit gamma and tau [Actinomycetales bacterium]|nr:DNA polymerase III subunit gamma and tau [Actinomycetales bacterium]